MKQRLKSHVNLTVRARTEHNKDPPICQKFLQRLSFERRALNQRINGFSPLNPNIKGTEHQPWNCWMVESPVGAKRS